MESIKSSYSQDEMSYKAMAVKKYEENVGVQAFVFWHRKELEHEPFSMGPHGHREIFSFALRGSGRGSCGRSGVFLENSLAMRKRS